jgi:predicted transcriptional regulator
MDQQTQTFLGLLSDELTALICAALTEKPLSSTELAKTVQTDPRVVAKHLEAMKLSALVRSYRAPLSGPGRPRIYWELINQSAIQKLSSFVKNVRHGLIDSGDG